MTNSYKNLKKLFIESVLKDLKEEDYVGKEIKKWRKLCVYDHKKHKFLAIRSVGEGGDPDIPHSYFIMIEDTPKNRKHFGIPLNSEKGVSGKVEYFAGDKDQVPEE